VRRQSARLIAGVDYGMNVDQVDPDLVSVIYIKVCPCFLCSWNLESVFLTAGVVIGNKFQIIYVFYWEVLLQTISFQR